MKIKRFDEKIDLYSECKDLLSAAIKSMKSGNPENLSPLVDIASVIDTYHEDAGRALAMEPGWYTDRTVNAFKNLVINDY